MQESFWLDTEEDLIDLVSDVENGFILDEYNDDEWLDQLFEDWDQ